MTARRLLVGAPLVAAGLLLAGCSSSPAAAPAPSSPPGAAQATSGSSAPIPSPTPSPEAAAERGGDLGGAVVVIDPGHNGGNARHPAAIGRLVDSGNGRKACDTAGTQTASGYTEAAFTWDLAQRLAARLRAAGARVVLTRSGNDGVGPCITERAAIGNRAAGPGLRVVALSLHADGGPPGGYGFHVIEPGPLPRSAVIGGPSRRLGTAVRDAFRAGTGEPYSTYTGSDGVTVRTDLGGLNLSAVPKVFIECGNMRNAADASRLSDAAWRERAAAALEQGVVRYVSSP